MKKKIINMILCFCVAFSYIGPSSLAFAEELDLLTEEVTTVNTTEENHIVVHSEEVDARGTLEIDLKFVLPIRNVEYTNIGMYLNNENGDKVLVEFNGISEKKEQSYTLGDSSGTVKIRKLDKNALDLSGYDRENSIVYYAVTIYGLKKGTYSLELFGNGYKTYNTNVTIDEYSKRISLSNETGMFEPGDLNNDGIVNDTDVNIMIDNLGTNSMDYDLNRDGIVDIADLNYITATMSGSKKEVVIQDTAAIVDNTKIEMVGGDGTLSGILTDDGSVSISPINGGEITEDNPAVLTLNVKEDKGIESSKLRVALGTEAPEKMVVTVEGVDANGTTYNEDYEVNGLSVSNGIETFTDEAKPNTITIDLKGQIAVKKITIKITATTAESKNLASIAKVEFLNNVKIDIDTPNLDKPTNVQAEALSESAKVTYNRVPNVTGYEITVKTMDGESVKKYDYYQTTYEEFTVGGLKNYTDYKVCVRSVNQEWKSDCSDEVTVTPKPTRKPPAVDMVTLTPVYAGFNIGWKKMDDTQTYNVYFREKGTTEFSKISNINGTSYQLRNLKVDTEYEIAVSGNNELGEGPKSAMALGKTKDFVMPDTYNFGLLNRPNDTEVTDHIKNVTLKIGNNYPSDDIYALVDNDFESYWEASTWDTGGYNISVSGVIVEFDDFYQISHMFLVPKDDTASFSYVRVYYWDENGNRTAVNASIGRLTSPNGQVYYKVQLATKVNTNKIQICLANYLATGNNALREIKFYEYNSLEDDVAALFKDDLRVELGDNVTEEMIAALEKRANTIEDESGEYHPNRNVILSDLTYARQILNDTAIRDVIVVDQSISNSKNGHLGIAMSINDYQPLGVVARYGEKLTVYVGTKGNVLPQLVFTQYDAEANVWTQTVTLKKGQNIIDVPKIGTINTERGGSVYIRYPSANASSEIKVRVSGGTKIPVLDIHNLTDETSKKAAIKTYIEELEKYTTDLSSLYEDSEYTYDRATSTLNSTEIVTKHGLLSVPATAVKDSIGYNLSNTEDKVNRVYESMSAFDEMVELFYRHKGLEENAANSKNEMPAARINIRYMRMFDGAFMYAGGLHVGIGYGSVAGLMQGTTYSNDTFNGYFGWGISHEIGHQLNQSKLAYAEVTNNVYSLLAQTANDTSLSRLEASNIYPKIYEKVTSNTIGKPGNVFVHLGMYWQLHLAYDDAKTFEDTNSIYARINRLTRSENVAGTADDRLIVYASKAAGKNLIPYFEKWGLVPSEETKATIASLLESGELTEEARAIWFLNDEARRKRMNGITAMDSSTIVNATITEADSQNKRFTLTFNVNQDSEKILGYEIRRNGESIAFVTGTNTFTDKIGAMNNQAIYYEIIAYDYLLNETSPVKLEEVKVSHDGSVKKGNFTISSNVKASGEIVDPENEEMDDEKLSIRNLIDDNNTTIFNGTEKVSKLVYSNNKIVEQVDTSNAYVIINLNTKMPVSGIKYKAALTEGSLMENTITEYNIYVSVDGENWIKAKMGRFNLTAENDYTDLIYFDKVGTTGGDQLWTYNDISYVKVESVGNTKGLSGAELDIIAPPGDNIDMSAATIGRLKDDYKYINSNGVEDIIPSGAVVIKGDYRGNPAYNAILLVDANNGSVITEDAEVFLFASLRDDAQVSEIASGIWFYVVSKEVYESFREKSVRAELYRVNDMNTLEGQRLTSTSLSVSNLPTYEELSDMEIIDSTKGVEKGTEE